MNSSVVCIFGTNKKLTKPNPFLLNIDLESSKKDVRTYIGLDGLPWLEGEYRLKREKECLSQWEHF